MMIRWTCCLLMLLGVTAKSSANITMGSLFADGMVLQRDMKVPVWGWGEPNEKVNVRFGDQSLNAVADSDGKWQIVLEPMKASFKSATMRVQGNNGLEIKNILVGEVWICSGQSNMEFPLSGAVNAEAEIAAADFPLIRTYLVGKDGAGRPQERFKGAWVDCSPKTAGGFSAVAYFFGRELYRELKVPVGLVMTSWGGTPAQSWTPIKTLQARPCYAHYIAEWEEYADTNMTFRQCDIGNDGEKDGWQKLEFDDSKWKDVEVPGPMEVNGLGAIDGAVWFRKTIELPSSWAGADLTLKLGAIDDFDVTYFNGEKVGAVGREVGSYWCYPRTYTIPGRLIKAGKNVIAVRVFDEYGNGGLVGKPCEMMLVKKGQSSLPLAGVWQCKIERGLKPCGGKSSTPSFLYNGMIAPAVPYAIRGAIWYQGESNSRRAYEYRTLFPDMIQGWRSAWGQGDFPFYFVQLANFFNRKSMPSESSWAELREAQLMTLKLPNTGMAVAIDIGEAKDIHPKNKQDVGRRLALNALAETYGKKIEYSGPLYKSMKIEGDKVRLAFTHTGEGLMAKGGELKGFAICGPDKVFVWANAKFDGDAVVVWSDKVKRPLAVRYGWADNPECTLYNKNGLPASPFRTDEFKGVTQP